MKFRPTVIVVHRWLGVAGLVFWLLQAVSGIVSVFHWEIDDVTVSGTHHPTDFAAIARRAADESAPGSGRQVDSIWSSAGFADRFDINITAPEPEGGEVLRVDGAGNVLRRRLDREKFRNGAFIDNLVLLHQSLLAGDTGRFIVGVSGLLLLSNLLMGLTVAWPRGGRWKTVLRPSWRGSLVARLYSWHRAFGLMVIVPAILLVSAGILLAFDDGVARVLHVSRPVVPKQVQGAGEPSIGMVQAIRIALRRFPAASVSGIRFPSGGDGTWTIALKQTSERQRAFGKTRVFIASDGRIVAAYDATSTSALHRFIDLVFPFHTGEMAGLAGRLVVLATGLWLATVMVLGASLWWKRRA
ncbi:MAG: PepSY-associated TM helix domain-containing protein [Acidobacteriota bacterium]